MLANKLSFRGQVLLESAFLLLVGLLVVIGVSTSAPYCMDEFLQYNEIIYSHYPDNSLNSYNEAPDLYDLNVYNSGLILPLRSYYYMGVLPALYYYPLFLAWQDPLSARFLGIVFLFLQAIVLGRIVSIRSGYLFITLLLFFPYLFQHVVETGMVGPQILCLLMVYLMLLRWSQRRKWIYPIGIAVFSFLGIWVKLSFLWYGPAILVLVLQQILENRRWLLRRGDLRRLLGQSAIGLAVLLILLSVLFLSTDPADSSIFPYWDELVDSPNGESLGLAELFDPSVLTRMEIYSTLWNPLRATERVLDPSGVNGWSIFYSTLLYTITPLLWLLVLLMNRGGTKKLLWRSVVLYLCFWLTVLIIFSNRMVWSMHHTILAYPFLILSFLTVLVVLRNMPPRLLDPVGYQRLLLVGLVAFIVLNSYYFAVFSKQHTVAENDPSRIELNAQLRDADLARSHMYVVLDWGMYFYQALYGHPEQSVLYIEPMTADEMQELEALREKTGRRVLILYHPDLPGHNRLWALIERFKLVSCNLTGDSETAGTPWQVMIEEDVAGEFCL